MRGRRGRQHERDQQEISQAADRGDRGHRENRQERELPARGRRAERCRRAAVEPDEREPPVPGRQRHHDAARERARHREVAGVDAEQVAEEQLLQPRRRGGRQREHPAQPEQRRDADRDADVARQAPVGGDERDPGRRHQHAPERAQHERRADQRGDDEPGQHPVADRLRRVRVAIEQHPDAERPAGDREDQHLDQRAHDDRRAERVGEPRQHRQCSCAWCPMPTARPPPSSTISSAP